MKLNEAIALAIKELEMRIYRNEAVGRCPFCESDDKKFYINTQTGQYSCKRGKCGASGNMNTLFKHMGIVEPIEYTDTDSSPRKNEVFRYDSSAVRDLTESDDVVIEYMISRGISYDSLVKAGVKYNEKHSSVAFEVKDNRNVVGVFYRSVLEKRMFMESGTRLKLWKAGDINESNDTAYITEGHIDALTLVEMGIENVLSMPNGARSHDWIEHDWDLLQKFNKIVLCYDNDTTGMAGFNEVKGRLDFATLYSLNYNDCNDINDMYMKDCEGLYRTVRTPTEVSMDGFISLQGVSSKRGVTDELHSTGLAQFDRIFGGLGFHQSTIICSESGSGKTTIVCNMIKGLLSTGKKVAIWSGELSNKQLKVWLYSTIGGEKAVEYEPHPFRKGEFISSIKPEYEAKIDKLVSGKLFIYDGNKSNAFEMIKHFHHLHKKHGVSYFFKDNLSILDTNIKGMNKYEGEEEYSKAVAAFTRNNPVHLFMVAHPTKAAINNDPNFSDNKGKVKPIERYTQQQVRGSASLVNLIHNVLFMAKAKDHERAYFLQKMQSRPDTPVEIIKQIEKEFSLMAYLVKNRSQGNVLEDVLFGYDRNTRRVYGLTTKKEDLSVELIVEDDKEEKLDGVVEVFDYDDY